MKSYTSIRISNSVNIFRNTISDYIFSIQDKYNIYDYLNGNNNYYEEEIEKYESNFILYKNQITTNFLELRKNNFSMYKNVISLMYHDCAIYIQNNQKEDYEEDIELFNTLMTEINNPCDLDKYICKDQELFFDIISNFIEYSKETYFNKRKRLLECSNLDDYLVKVYPLHILDKLYYTLCYNLDSLVLSVDNYNENSIGVIIDTLRSLYNSDIKNYNDLMLELLEIYYKNNLFVDCHNSLLGKIENGDLTLLLKNIIFDDDALEDVVFEFYLDTTKYDDSYREKVNNFYDKKKQKVKMKIKENRDSYGKNSR